MDPRSSCSEGRAWPQARAARVSLPRSHVHHPQGETSWLQQHNQRPCPFPHMLASPCTWLHPAMLGHLGHAPPPALLLQRRLPATLRAALGDELAWSIMPRSFCLPEEMEQLRELSSSQSASAPAPAPQAQAGAGDGAAAQGPERGAAAAAAAAGEGEGEGAADINERQARSLQGASTSSGSSAGGDELWVLKTSQHLGRGLKLVALHEVRCRVCGREQTWHDGTVATQLLGSHGVIWQQLRVFATG